MTMNSLLHHDVYYHIKTYLSPVDEFVLSLTSKENRGLFDKSYLYSLTHILLRTQGPCAVRMLHWAIRNTFINKQNKDLVYMAAKYDNAPVVRILRETYGAPWDNRIFQIQKLNDRIASYAMQNHCPLPFYCECTFCETSVLIRQTLCNGHETICADCYESFRFMGNADVCLEF